MFQRTTRTDCANSCRRRNYASSSKHNLSLSLSLSLSLAFLVVSLFVPFSAFATPAFAETKGDFEVIDNTSDASSVCSFANDVLTIESGDVTLSTTKQTNQRIVVGTANTTGEVNLHLDGVDIKTSSGSALEILDRATFNVNIELVEGTANMLDASLCSDNAAGLSKESREMLASSQGFLNISGGGSLTARGAHRGSGIGGKEVASESQSAADNITIENCSIKTTGGDEGAGIGTPREFTSSGCFNLHIKNATVFAQGFNAPGIGGEMNASNFQVENSRISAESIETVGVAYAAIGGGIFSDSSFANSTIQAYARSSAAAGIGGGFIPGAPVDGWTENVSFNDCIIHAYGGASYSGIGGGAGSQASSGNSVSGNSMIYAAAGSSYTNALEGFDTSGLTGGIVFEGAVSSYTDNPFENPYEVTWNKGTIYGETTLSKAMAESLELPATTTIDTNATFKVAADSHLTIPNAMSLQNEGNLSSLDNITIENGGSITTANNFYLKDATSPSTSNYATYLTHTGVIGTYTAVPAFPQNYIHGWFSNKDGTGIQVYNGKQVELNTHNFYEVENDAYQIQVPDVENGTVSIDKYYAYQGDKVSFTLVPDEGYTVESVSVTTKDGTTLPLDTTGDTHSFEMPGSEVTINATFVADGPTPPGPGPEPTPSPEPSPATDGSDLLPVTGDMNGPAILALGIVGTGIALALLGGAFILAQKRDA